MIFAVVIGAGLAHQVATEENQYYDILAAKAEKKCYDRNYDMAIITSMEGEVKCINQIHDQINLTKQGSAYFLMKGRANLKVDRLKDKTYPNKNFISGKFKPDFVKELKKLRGPGGGLVVGVAVHGKNLKEVVESISKLQ